MGKVRAQPRGVCTTRTISFARTKTCIRHAHTNPTWRHELPKSRQILLPFCQDLLSFCAARELNVFLDEPLHDRLPFRRGNPLRLHDLKVDVFHELALRQLIPAPVIRAEQRAKTTLAVWRRVRGSIGPRCLPSPPRAAKRYFTPAGSLRPPVLIAQDL